MRRASFRFRIEPSVGAGAAVVCSTAVDLWRQTLACHFVWTLARRWYAPLSSAFDVMSYGSPHSVDAGTQWYAPLAFLWRALVQLGESRAQPQSVPLAFLLCRLCATLASVVVCSTAVDLGRVAGRDWFSSVLSAFSPAPCGYPPLCGVPCGYAPTLWRPAM